MAGLLTAEHLGALAVVFVSAAALIGAARMRPGDWTTAASRALAVVLAVDEVSWWLFLPSQSSYRADLAHALPLQLCDVGIIVAALALWFRRPMLVELTYFWGLAGSLQALLTPDLPQHFPSYPYFQYYIAHGGVVAAALWLVAGLRLWPRPYAVVRVALLTIAYAAIIGLVDAATSANYMYLRSKPPSPTLLDLLGPWPVYLVWATIVGALFLAALDAPFHLMRCLRADATAVKRAN